MAEIRKDFLTAYKEANEGKRMELLFEFYAKIPQRITMIENRTKYLVKAELEYLRSHNREVLGTRIQTSNVSDITFSEALENIEIEQAVDGNGGCLKHIASLEKYKYDIEVINNIREHYTRLNEVIASLDDDSSELFVRYFVDKRSVNELCDTYNISYAGMKKRIHKLRDEIYVEMQMSLEVFISGCEVTA